MNIFFSVNGERLWQSFEKENYETVSEWLDYYRNHSGKNYLIQQKYEYTENPTIQGMWHPFVNTDPEIATAKFPVVSKRKNSYLKVLTYLLVYIDATHRFLIGIFNRGLMCL